MTLKWINGDSSGLEWLGAPSALGQPTFEQCFRDDPNFTPCWQSVFRQSQVECQSIMTQPNPYPNYDACVETVARQHASQTCIPACEAYLRGGALYPWGQPSNETCELQREINEGLRAQGYNAIAEDCRLGPATCGAADFLGMGVPATCVGRPWTAPTRSGQAPRPTPPPPMARKSRAGPALLAALALVAGGFALVGRG